MKKLAAKVISNPASFGIFASMINSEEFKSKIKEAAEDPTSSQAVLIFGSRNNLLGSIGDAESVSRAMTMATRYGSASTFLTITPDDVTSVSLYATKVVIILPFLPDSLPLHQIHSSINFAKMNL
jgi:hypothetical protein